MASSNIIVPIPSETYLLTHGEKIAVDRGFGIEEMHLTRGCEIAKPPGAKGVNAYDHEQLNSAKSIANRRIIIEQVIGRLRFFNILNNTLPWQYTQVIDHIVRAICIFTNLLPPAQKRDK